MSKTAVILSIYYILSFFKKYGAAAILLTFILSEQQLAAQKRFTEAEFLKKLNDKNVADTEKVVLMSVFSVSGANNNSRLSIDYALKAIELAKKINYMKGLLRAYEAAGDAYWSAYNYDKSVDYYLKELKLADSLHETFSKAKANYNIGWIKCVQQGLFSERGKLIHSLEVFQSIRDTVSVIMVCNALSSVYQSYSKHHPEYRDSSNFYFRNMVYLGERIPQNRGLITIYSNYSTFLLENKKYVEAKNYVLKSLAISTSFNDTFGTMNGRNILANLLYNTDSVSKAKKIYEEVIPIMKRKDYKDNLLDAYHTMYLIYKEEKDYNKALEYHLLFKEVSDTLNAVVFKSNLQEKESAYEIAKREENIQQLRQRNEVSELRNKQNNHVIAGMALIGILVVAFTFNLFRSNKNKQKANLLLSHQNKIIADKKEEIEQSIHYAKGIQTAILPSVDELKRSLPNTFLVYLPKDVVSGDFYWFHHTRNEGKILIAAADCTGHGVPGSLMSIVSVDKLNHAIFEKKLEKPGQILSSINNDIRNALKQDSSTNKQKDGLDIALVLVDSKTNTITYSGANRPLWIVRNGEVIEYKATKTSIAGHTDLNQEFAEHEVQLRKDDLVVISSDGYADQFGGMGGKKMMTRNFKHHLTGMAGKPVKDIEALLIKGFNDWKGAHEQVDDVLVIGFKV